jgi:large subunit ribosomal protein L25
MSTTKALTAELRDRVGKGAARALRRNHRVPAVIYGGKEKPVGISLDGNEMFKLLHGGGFKTTIFEINLGGSKERVIPRDFQTDPVKDFLTHVDFLRVGKDTVVSVAVPVHVLNEDKAPGIKAGGMIALVEHTVQLYCPADKIPDAIEVDVAGMEIGDSVHLSAVKLPNGVKPVAHEDETVLTLSPPKVAIEADQEEAEAEAAAEAEAPEAEADKD